MLSFNIDLLQVDLLASGASLFPGAFFGRRKSTVNRAQTQKLFKSISNSLISLSFLLIWNWNDKNVQTLRNFLRKPNPFSDQNDANTLPDGAAHTHMAYIRECPPPPEPWSWVPKPVSQVFFPRFSRCQWGGSFDGWRLFFNQFDSWRLNFRAFDGCGLIVNWWKFSPRV